MLMNRFCAFLLLLLGISTTLHAAELAIPAFTGDGEPSKRLTSLREVRFQYVVEQKTDYSCGAAALATLLRYAFARPITENDVIVGMFNGANAEQVRKQGFSMLDMKRYVNSLQLRASGFVTGVEKLPSLRIPVIIMLDINGYKHFVVLKLATKDSVFIADPALGNRSLRMDEFKRQWNGVLLAVAGPGYRPNTPLRRIPAILSARSAVNSMQPVELAELVEYGFLHSDFF